MKPRFLDADSPAGQRWIALQNHWQALGARERGLLQLAGAALGLLLLWSVAVQPALRILRQTPAQLTQLDAQLQTMQALALETRELRAQPMVPASQARQALQAASEHLGTSARLNVSGDRAVLSLNGVGSEALQSWLAEVRGAARARPVEASLQRGPQGYSGTIVLALGTAP
ncbi:type II secretion system protein M [Roseateles sp. DAIF2]|uniref:type II secretion system protein GspM n=1 Tax=Roseateles sp. DAIF2 TaxID=2714952 RepID=UPI0018A2F1D5|nr:type II secretion system protein GspM [Roseateles sp. DAIF2]QPF72514.1 type II secretion system protein M [Roseateles sp. DAIF2]